MWKKKRKKEEEKKRTVSICNRLQESQMKTPVLQCEQYVTNKCKKTESYSYKLAHFYIIFHKEKQAIRITLWGELGA